MLDPSPGFAPFICSREGVMSGVVAVLGRAPALSADTLFSFESGTPSPSKEGLAPEEDALLALVLGSSTGIA